MSEKRQWDENRSPQWKYMFQKESTGKRNVRRNREKKENEKRIEEENEYANMSATIRKEIKHTITGNKRNRKIDYDKRNIE